MKIRCECGTFIVDQTDFLSNKAHIIGDKDYFDYLNTIDGAIESQEQDRSGLCHKIHRADPSRLAYECNHCGRLYLYDSSNELVAYLPENGKANRIFDRDRSQSKC